MSNRVPHVTYQGQPVTFSRLSVNACRFCTKAPIRSQYGEPIKYSVRHYAHAECGLRELGAAFFGRLTFWQLQDFPYFAAKQFGLADELNRRINEAEERSL